MSSLDLKFSINFIYKWSSNLGMKHTLKVTLFLVSLFFVAQVVGLLVTVGYMDQEAAREAGEIRFEELPYDIDRPPVEQKSSFIFIFIAILVGTILVLLLIRFKKTMLWRLWFFLAVVLSLSIAFSAFINPYIAFLLSLILSVFKIFKPNIYIHNITEVFVYGGLAAIFVPVMNLFAVFILLMLISIYDFIAVFKIKHMVTMAKFQTKSKMFAGLLIPYKRGKIGNGKKEGMVKKVVKTAILGGGDIGFPLLFSGVVMKGMMVDYGMVAGFLRTLIIPVIVSAFLFLLFVKGKKDRFYPAMPVLTAGCFFGYGVLLLINLI